MGSNGLTSARHDVFAKHLAHKYPESYDMGIDPDLVYSGNYKLTDIIEPLGITAGKLVLSPTRTYAPIINEVLTSYRQVVHGLVHCSGGAQTKVLNFVENLLIVKDNLFPVPPLFEIIQKQSQTPWNEMYKVFNMGHRMEIYVSPEYAAEIIAISKKFGVDAQVIGYCKTSNRGNQLIIKSDKGEFVF